MATHEQYISLFAILVRNRKGFKGSQTNPDVVQRERGPNCDFGGRVQTHRRVRVLASYPVPIKSTFLDHSDPASPDCGIKVDQAAHDNNNNNYCLGGFHKHKISLLY